MRSGLSRESFLAARRREFVPLPEFATPENPEPGLWVQSLSAGDLIRYEDALEAARKDPDRMATVVCELVAKSAADAGGAPLFTDADVAALRETDGLLVQTAFAAVVRLNRPAGGADAGKFSGRVPAATPPTGSPANSANGTLTASSPA